MCVMDNCCGADLRSGSFVIGYLNLLFNSVNIILLSVSWNTEAKVVPKDKEEEFIKSFLIVMLIISLVLFVLNLLFNIILLIGTHKKIRGCIKAYLIFTSIIIAIFILELLSSFKLGLPFYMILIRIAYLVFLCISATVAKSYMLKGDFGNNFASYPKASVYTNIIKF